MKKIFDLPLWLNESMLVLVKKIINTIDTHQSVEDHSFYITFITTDNEVIIPNDLKETYPQSMTIVLEHQFDNLQTTDDGFFITLFFSNNPKKLFIPYHSVINIFDKNSNFSISLDYIPIKAKKSKKRASSKNFDNVIIFPK